MLEVTSIMYGSLAASYILAVTLTISSPAQEITNSPNNSIKNLREQVKQMEREAHTREDYSALANSYSALKKAYLQQAEEERQEWVRRSANTTSLSQKYPRPADSAKYLYEYYTMQADAMGKNSERYSRLAGVESQQSLPKLQ